ncbi:hypothetical protein FI667_g12596, partial [Globisporangium splendens]
MLCLGKKLLVAHRERKEAVRASVFAAEENIAEVVRRGREGRNDFGGKNTKAAAEAVEMSSKTPSSSSFLLSSPRSLVKGLGLHHGKDAAKSEPKDAKPGFSHPNGTSDSMPADKTMEGYLFLRIHVRRRRYCVLTGRTLHVFDTKEESLISSTKRSTPLAKKIITVVGVKDAMELEKTIRSTLLGNGNHSTFENALIISTQKSKLVVVEAETHTEKQRWLHAMSCLNFASSSSEKTFFLSMLQDTTTFDAHVAVTLLHKYRNNEVATELIIDRLAEYSECNIDDVEFYIQQIMHLVVNAEMTKTDKLVNLLLSICKAKTYVEHLGNCIHLALQLFWLLEAKIQDKDPNTYNLCAKLLMSIEAKVVNQHLELPANCSGDGVSRLLMEIPGMKERLHTMTRQKSENQEQLHNVASKVSSPRPEELSTAPAPAPAMKPPAPLTIDTSDVSTGESTRTPSAGATPTEVSSSAIDVKQQRELLLEWMEKERLKRYKYFHQQRDFVKALTDISEKMRLIDPPARPQETSAGSTREVGDSGDGVYPTGPRLGCFLCAPCLLCFEVIEDHVNAAGHRDSVPKPKTSTTPRNPHQSYSPHRRVNSASTCSSVVDEVAEVIGFIKKYSINGKVICFEEQSVSVGSDAAEEASRSQEGDVDSSGDNSKPHAGSLCSQGLAATLEGLDKQLGIPVIIEEEEETGYSPRLNNSVCGDSLASSASIPSSSMTDECSLIRRHSKTAYEFGLSKMLSDSGVFGESWKEKKVVWTLSLIATSCSQHLLLVVGAHSHHIAVRPLARMECDLTGTES